MVSLRPSNKAVPSYRPLHKEGCTCTVRQLAPGVGEGQHTGTVDDLRRMYKSQSGRPINRQGSGKRANVLLRVLGRSPCQVFQGHVFRLIP